MGLDVWTLPMTIAWIAWRSPDAVRTWWDCYREECLEWHGCETNEEEAGNETDSGWYSLEPPEPPTLIQLHLCEIYRRAEDVEGASQKSVEQAKAELWSMLCRGVIEATGVDCRTAERVRIAPAVWQDLDVTKVEEHDVLQAMRQFPVGPCYDEVHFDARQVRDVWLPELDVSSAVPPLVPPEGKGHMPLFCAAMWIATSGGKVEFSRSSEVWQDALGRLLEEIVAGNVVVIGVRDGVSEIIEGHVFSSCRVSYPFDDWRDDMLFGEDLVLVCRPYIDDEHWHAGVDDSLRNCRGARWTRISVRATDVLTIWSSDTACVVSTPLTHSGLAGRPSSNHLIAKELERRCASGEALAVLAHEAEALLQWLLKTYPDLRPPTSKTIKNNSRVAHRRYRAMLEGPK